MTLNPASILMRDYGGVAVQAVRSPSGDAWARYDAGTAAYPGLSTKTFTASYWFKSVGAGTQVHWNSSNSQTASRNFIALNASGNLWINLVNGAAGVVLDAVTTQTYRDGLWHHVAFWCDMANPATRGIYVDDADTVPTWTTYIDDFLGLGFRYAVIFNRYDGAFQTGDLDLSEIAVDTRNLLDLGIEANRRLFINADKSPNTNRAAWPATIDSLNFGDTGTGKTVAQWITNAGTAAASGFYSETSVGLSLTLSTGPTQAGSA